MKNSKKRLLSFLLASTVIVGAPTVARAANDNTEEVAVEQNYDEPTYYTIQKGDTLGQIALKYYGDAAFYQALADYNHIKNPGMIYAGDVIILPKVLNTTYNYWTNEAIIPSYSDDNVYTIKCGDNLEAICNAFYGMKDRCVVDRLATYNGLSDPNQIIAGNTIRIPEFNKLMNVMPKDYSQQYAEMSVKLSQLRRWREYWKYYGCPGMPIPPVPVPFPEDLPEPPKPETPPCLHLVP